MGPENQRSMVNVQTIQTIAAVCLLLLFIVTVTLTGNIGERRGYFKACMELGRVVITEPNSNALKCVDNRTLNMVYKNEFGFNIPSSIPKLGPVPQP